jgi:hypothetical protein
VNDVRGRSLQFGKFESVEDSERDNGVLHRFCHAELHDGAASFAKLTNLSVIRPGLKSDEVVFALGEEVEN